MDYLQQHIFRQAPAATTAKDALVSYMKDKKQLPPQQIQFMLQMLSQLKLVPMDQLENVLAGIPSAQETPSGEEAALIVNYMDELNYDILRKNVVANKFNIDMNKIIQKHTNTRQVQAKSETPKSQGLSTVHIVIIVVAVVVVLAVVIIFVAFVYKKPVITQTAMQNMVRQNRVAWQ